jgi:predicted enzyme related to lactoylglutathione lyase
VAGCSSGDGRAGSLVEDTDAAVAKVSSLDGTTARPAWDSPYGRMAVMADDHGAAFSVIMAPAGNA